MFSLSKTKKILNKLISFPPKSKSLFFFSGIKMEDSNNNKIHHLKMVEGFSYKFNNIFCKINHQKERASDHVIIFGVKKKISINFFLFSERETSKMEEKRWKKRMMSLLNIVTRTLSSLFQINSPTLMSGWFNLQEK